MEQGKNLKILYTASTAAHLRHFHLPYLTALRDAGAAVTCAAAGEGTGLPENIRFLSLPFTKSFSSVRNLEAAGILADRMRRGGYDLVLCHTSLAAFFTRLAVRRAGKGASRVVNVVHGYLFDSETPVFRRTVLLLAEKIMAPVTDEIFTMNAQDTQIALRHRLCRRRVAQIRGMGYDASRCRAASPGEKLAARRQLSIPEDALVLLCAAEFSRRKNQSFLLDAMLGLSRNTVLLLPGDGERLDACQKRADDLGLAGRVFFPGYVSDLSLWRAASDICVSAARSEGLPFHVMEAMACGLPCVLSAVKGHEDLAFGARLFPYGDRAAFAQAVNDVSVRTRVPEGIEDYRLENVLKDNLNLFSGGRI